MWLQLMRVVFTGLFLILAGDFLSTFFYHVPQHVYYRLHLNVHHHRKRSYWDYAVLSLDPKILSDGFLGALPYFLLVWFLWPVSWAGCLLGLAFGQFHVWWRHTSKLGMSTPLWVKKFCYFLFIVTPEVHWKHHINPSRGFGDIFTFYDQPARWWLYMLVQQHRKRLLVS
jgi:hypothetical protein